MSGEGDTPASRKGTYAPPLAVSPTAPNTINWTFREGDPVLIDQQAAFTMSRYVRLRVWVDDDGSLRVRLGQWGEMVDRTLDEPT